MVLWSAETTFGDVARVAAAPPPDLRSAFRPTYNLAVNLVRRFDRPTAMGVLHRSFAQWQAAARWRSTGAAGTPPDALAELLGRRLAVLESMGYVRGWSLTDAGTLLAGVYHESDLLVAELVTSGVLEGAEPPVLAGVLSALVFERRRARRTFGEGGRHRGRPGTGRRPPAKGAGDRLGERRRSDLAARLAEVGHLAERVRAAEEVHLVPRTRQPEPVLAPAVCSWVRGAPFATVLAVAAGEGVELAPGDLVRVIKQVADLAEQVSTVVGDPAQAEAAVAAARLAVRDVVASGGPRPSPSGDTPPP